MCKHNIPQIPNNLVAPCPFSLNVLEYVFLEPPIICHMDSEAFETMVFLTDIDYFYGNSEDFHLHFLTLENQ